MKNVMVVLMLVAGISQAAFIHSARYDAKTDEVVLDITYGGCGAETFKLEFGACLETYPSQIHATLDDSQDVCRGIIREEMSFGLTEMNGCRPASLSISTGNGPRVQVSVPEVQAAVGAVKVGKQAHQFKIDSVNVKMVGEHGFPSSHVFATATFGNSCTVPLPNELISMVQYSKNFDSLILSVGSISKRICPAVYMPETVTLDLGIYSRPNDGLFSLISVNGVASGFHRMAAK